MLHCEQLSHRKQKKMENSPLLEEGAFIYKIYVDSGNRGARRVI